MTKMILLPLLLLLLALSSTGANGTGRMTESQKKESRFFKCILAIERADTNKDRQLTRPEYQPFIKQLSILLFDDTLLEDDELPRDLGHLYNQLVVASGAADGAKAIDIFGASVAEIGSVQQDRLDALHATCEMVMKELAMLGPQTDAPMQLAVDLLTEEEFEEEEDDAPKESQSLEEEIISVHSSFVISNMASLRPNDLDLGPDGTLYATYVDFIDELMDAVCPMGLPCPEEPDDTVVDYETYQEAHNATLPAVRFRRKLCGSYRHMRRMLCGPQTDLGRRLAGGIFADAELYEVKTTQCPAEVSVKPNQHGVLPQCHTVFAHYDVMVQHDGSQLDEIEHNYISVTKAAIADGMLQDSLDKVDPDSVFTVHGPGAFRYPRENQHHMRGEASKKDKKHHHYPTRALIEDEGM